MQLKLNGLLAARTELKSAPARVTTLKAVLQRVAVKKEKSLEQVTEAESALEEAQKYVITCRTTVDSHVAEMISVQQRLDQALYEMPVEQPQGDQVQSCLANSMALASAAMASACITQHEQVWFVQMLQRMGHGVQVLEHQQLPQAQSPLSHGQAVDALPHRRVRKHHHSNIGRCLAATARL